MGWLESKIGESLKTKVCGTFGRWNSNIITWGESHTLEIILISADLSIFGETTSHQLIELILILKSISCVQVLC